MQQNINNKVLHNICCQRSTGRRMVFQIHNLRRAVDCGKSQYIQDGGEQEAGQGKFTDPVSYELFVIRVISTLSRYL